MKPKNEKKLGLSREAELEVSSLEKKRSRVVRLNASIDPQGTAVKCSLKLRTK